MFTTFRNIILVIILVISGCERDEITNPVNDNLPPAVPTNLAVFYSHDGTIGIEWVKNNEPDLSGYNIYRKTGNGNYQGILFTTNNYFYNDSLSYSIEYSYKITAIDIYGHESLLSDSVSAIPINKFPPLTPKNPFINAKNIEGKLSVYLSWNKTLDGDVFNYNIYRSTDPDFNSDSTTLIGSTGKLEFSDTLNLQLYTTYCYSIKAVDNGGLLSDPTYKISDQIYGAAQPVYPENNSQPGPFGYFKIRTIQKPVQYQVIVQTNPYFGDFWTKYFTSDVINDTISIKFDPPYREYNATYYWQIVTYSPGQTNPNSISEQFSFINKY
ncbi:MAG TPA: hypothetical protein VKA26_12065 [Ignavibacteriaceae bacterium]|nr:hypothetical protein [Ignavibacteriaceae bacterium]